MLTEAALKEALTYDPVSGDFFWNGRASLFGSNQGRETTPAGSVNTRGYRTIRIDRRYYKAHRLAVLYMTGEWPSEVVDHINRNPSDNRWANLRCCSQQENMLNSRAYLMEGVHLRKDSGRWEAKAMLRGKRVQIGCFDTRQAAISARRFFLHQKAQGLL